MKSISQNNLIQMVLDTKNEIQVRDREDGRFDVYEIDKWGEKTLRVGGATSEPEVKEVTGEEVEVKEFLNKQAIIKPLAEEA